MTVILRSVDIKHVVSAVFLVSVKQLEGRQRDAKTALARHAAFYLCRTHTGLSTNQIAGLFGRADHTTVLHGARRISNLLDKSDQGELKNNLYRCRVLLGVSP